MDRVSRTIALAGIAVCLLTGAGGAEAASFQAMNFGSEVALNPQPLPPGDLGGVFLGDEVALNPQPLPPKLLKRKLHLQFGDEVSLNPQQPPPKEQGASFSFGDEVSLNPQPLPPKVFVFAN